MTKRGFTIIELMVTVLIIALLLAAASAGIVRTRRTARDGQRIRDVLALSTAVDQSATANRGLYPYNSIVKTTAVFCADLLTNAPVGINLGIFLNRKLPTDPLPEMPASSCANYRNGYTYHSRYGGNNLARTGTAQDYEYVIEVGLESDRPSDERTLTKGTDASSTRRTQFLIKGAACTGTGVSTCSTL